MCRRNGGRRRFLRGLSKHCSKAQSREKAEKGRIRERLHKEVASPFGFVVSQIDWIVGKSIHLEDYIMGKYIYDEKNGLWYEKQGDYYIPCLSLPEEKQKPVGVWGQRHLRYIKQHKRVFYANLLTSCKLNSYLVDVDKQAEDMFSRLVKELAEKENVTEKLKAENQMLWVQRMNSIRNRATEIVNADLIYA